MQQSNDVITKEYIVDTLNKISTANKSTIDSCITSLTQIKDTGTITEGSMNSLCNICLELEALRELFINRIINSLKRGNMVIN